MTGVAVRAGRRYSGLEPEERKAARRKALTAAAIRLFGTKGFTSTTVKQICAEADLTQRYFYESFADRHACLVAVYDGIIDDARDVTVAALAEASGFDEMAVRGVTAFVKHFTDDPLLAQIVMIEVVGVSPELEKRRHGVLSEFAELVAAVWAQNVTSVDRALTGSMAVAMVGAVNHLLVDWLLAGRRQDPADLVSVCVALFEAARDRITTPAP